MVRTCPISDPYNYFSNVPLAFQTTLFYVRVAPPVTSHSPFSPQQLKHTALTGGRVPQNPHFHNCSDAAGPGPP